MCSHGLSRRINESLLTRVGWCQVRQMCSADSIVRSSTKTCVSRPISSMVASKFKRRPQQSVPNTTDKEVMTLGHATRQEFSSIVINIIAHDAFWLGYISC